MNILVDGRVYGKLEERYRGAYEMSGYVRAETPGNGGSVGLPILEGELEGAEGYLVVFYGEGKGGEPVETGAVRCDSLAAAVEELVEGDGRPCVYRELCADCGTSVSDIMRW